MEDRSREEMRVTLLGTGAPPPLLERFGPATLVEAGGRKFLFDAGRGALQRLFQLGIPFAAIDALFLTHLHSDHVVGLPDLWLTGRIGLRWGQRKVPLPLWGPAGTAEMAFHLEKAFAFDLRIRSRDYESPGAELSAREFGDGAVYESEGVKITAFEVDHGPVVKPAFGFRIDCGGRCAVLSGDTRLNENLIRRAAGADLLVHEVAAVDEETLRGSPNFRRILGNHASPEEAGEVFSRVRPKLAVYTHILLFGSAVLADLVPRTRARYPGPLEVGEDLMSVEVGETVRVRRFGA